MNVTHDTPLKQAMMFLLKKHHLVSVPQLVLLLRDQGMTVNKTSVYRTIQHFLAEGMLCQQLFDGEVQYELQSEHHDHFYCTQCGQVKKIACQVKQTATADGDQIAHHHVTLYGSCAGCQKE